MHFFAWTIRLPERLKDRIIHEIEKVEEELKMEYIPLWERDSHEEGVKIGVKEGVKIGVKEGREEGRQEGRQEEKIKMAKKLKEKGIDIALISEASGLSKKEIEKL